MRTVAALFVGKAVLIDSHHVDRRVTGEQKKARCAEAEAERDLWVSAVNNDGRFGRWGFLEVTDPWGAANLIRATFLARPLATAVPVR